MRGSDFPFISGAVFMDLNSFFYFYKIISAVKIFIRKQEFSLHLEKSFTHTLSAWKISAIVESCALIQCVLQSSMHRYT